MIIELIRHADSTWTEEADKLPEPVFGGRMSDVDLSETGVKRAWDFGLTARRKRIMPVDSYSSPARRAVRTHLVSMRAMTGRRPAMPHIDPDLVELTWGDWERKPRCIAQTDAVQRERNRKGLNFAPPGGESFNEVRERALQAIMAAAAEHPDPNALVWVHTHNNVIKAVVQPWYRWTANEITDIRVGVLSRTRLQVVRGKLDVVFFNQPI